MPCSRKETLARLFSDVTTTLKFFFVFFYLFSLFVAKLFTYFIRREEEYDDALSYEEEEGETMEVEEVEEEEQEDRHSHVYEGDHLIADIVSGNEGLVFVPKNFQQTEHNLTHVHNNCYEILFEDPVQAFDDETFYVENCERSKSGHYDYNADYELVKEEYTATLSESNTDKRFESTNVHNNNNDHHTELDSQSQQFQSTYVDIPPESPINLESRRYCSETNGEDDHGKLHRRMKLLMAS